MKLIAVSGSTKCDWRLVSPEGIKASFNSKGLNPFFHSQGEIASIVSELKPITDNKAAIREVYVYSAGCGSKALQNIVRNGLSVVLPRPHMLINHDIVASALATYQGVPCIACILGTGSNSCFFDGDIVRQEVPALDYVLGDEGGGSYYGKKLLSAHLHNKLPKDLEEKFRSKYHLNREEILEKVYMKPYANVYLASFMTFYQENKEDPFVIKTVTEGMRLFMKLFILPYHGYKNITCHFTGSIAFYFEDILQKVAKELELTVGKVIKEPIDDLVKYHLKK